MPPHVHVRQSAALYKLAQAEAVHELSTGQSLTMEHICLISSFLLINGQYVSALIVTVRIIANESLLNVYISQNKWQKCYFLHFFVFPAVLKTYRTMTFVYCYSPSTNQHGQYIGSLLTSH